MREHALEHAGCHLVLGVLNRNSLEVANTHLAFVETELVGLGFCKRELLAVILGGHLVLLASHDGSNVCDLAVGDLVSE